MQTGSSFEDLGSSCSDLRKQTTLIGTLTEYPYSSPHRSPKHNRKWILLLHVDPKRCAAIPPLIALLDRLVMVTLRWGRMTPEQRTFSNPGGFLPRQKQTCAQTRGKAAEGLSAAKSQGGSDPARHCWLKGFHVECMLLLYDKVQG